MAKCEVTGEEKNNLIMLNCSNTFQGMRAVYLMGLAEMEKKNQTTEGWILLISGNPLIPRGRGGHFSNKLHIDKLHMTYEQKQAILYSSINPDENVYLYAGKFFMGKCQHSDECHRGKVMKVLIDHLCRYHVAVDFRRVVPFKELRLREIVIPGQMNKKDYHGNVENRDKLPHEEEMEFHKEDFKFQSTLHEIFVDLECPTSHSGYHVEIYFVQAFDRKPSGIDPCARRRITRLLEHDKVFVPPNPTRKTSVISVGNSMDKVTIRVKVLEIPAYNSMRCRKILNNFNVSHVEYWVVARLLKNDEWNGLTMATMIVREVGLPEGLENGSATKPNSSQLYSCFRRTLSIVEPSSSISAFPQCSTPFKLVVMEMELEHE